MIPHGLMTCYLTVQDRGEIETRILDCSVLGFTFRLPKRMLLQAGEIKVVFHMLMDGINKTVLLSDAAVEQTESTEWWNEYRLETRNADFRNTAAGFMKQYSKYTEMKALNDTRGLAYEMCGKELPEEEYCGDIEEQRALWVKKSLLPAQWECAKDICIALGDPSTVRAYLDQPVGEFYAEYCEKHGFATHPVSKAVVNCLYLGNQYCEHLLPAQETAALVMKKARRENLRVILVLPPIRESRRNGIERMIDKLVHTQQLTEICVNDWGMMELLRSERFEGVALTMGILLCKRRKDPRMDLISESHTIPDASSIDDAQYRQWLKNRYDEIRMTCEAGINAHIGVLSAVHWPLVQLNTAEYCTLKAVCESGDRAHQKPCDSCKHYCEKHYFLYPKESMVVGKYNTLFACQSEQEQQRFDRFVIDLL